MNKLSVVIITFNEERNISRCLKSVESVADEIVIVDSLSIDSTKNICSDFDVNYVEHEFLGYSAQKNYANSLTKYKYILSIDADEELSKELQKSILTTKKDFLFDAYYINRYTCYCGKWLKYGAWYPDRKIRIWNKEKGSWDGEIHESVVFDKKESSCRLKGDILHYSYHSIENHISQFNKFTTLSAAEMAKKGKKASYFKIFLSPFSNFIKGFFIKLGFLDGYYGIVVVFINSFATFLKYIKLRKINNESAENI